MRDIRFCYCGITGRYDALAMYEQRLRIPRPDAGLAPIMARIRPPDGAIRDRWLDLLYNGTGNGSPWHRRMRVAFALDRTATRPSPPPPGGAALHPTAGRSRAVPVT